MSCILNKYDPTDLTVTTDGCTLAILDGDGNVLKTMNLSTMNVQQISGVTYLTDGTTGFQATDADMVALGISAATLLPLIQACKMDDGSMATPPLATDGSVEVVCDINDPTMHFLIQVKYDEITDTFTYTKTDGTAVVEGVDFKICAPVDKTWIECRSWIDDVAGDESGELVSFVEPICISVTNGIISSTSMTPPYYTDKYYSTPYTVQGTQRDPNTVGRAIHGIINYEILDPSEEFIPSFGDWYGISWFVEGATNTDGTFNFSSGAQFCTYQDDGVTLIDQHPIPNGHSAQFGLNLKIGSNQRIKAGTARIIITSEKRG